MMAHSCEDVGVIIEALLTGNDEKYDDGIELKMQELKKTMIRYDKIFKENMIRHLRGIDYSLPVFVLSVTNFGSLSTHMNADFSIPCIVACSLIKTWLKNNEHMFDGGKLICTLKHPPIIRNSPCSSASVGNVFAAHFNLIKLFAVKPAVELDNVESTKLDNVESAGLDNVESAGLDNVESAGLDNVESAGLNNVELDVIKLTNIEYIPLAMEV
jgi:hypothetical protein